MKIQNKNIISDQVVFSKNNIPLEDLLSQKKISKQTYDKV